MKRWDEVFLDYHELAMQVFREVKWNEFFKDLNERWFYYLYDLTFVGNDAVMRNIRNARNGRYKLDTRNKRD